MDKVIVLLMGFLMGIIMIALFGLLIALLLMLIWNGLVAGWMGLATLTFWQAYGLVFCSGILFKSSTTVKTNEA